MGWLDPRPLRELGEKLSGMGAWSGSGGLGHHGYQGVNLEAIKGIGGGMGKSKARWKRRRLRTQSGWSRVSDEEKRALKKVYKATKAKLS
ncbi:hypothetical protein H5410_023655 [Solanum commersonii]|uniref:Uncharacterized protein n=1 Tax=Solanum commersonii TaxID=4109 RepID=A0A9J5ZK49_SOLCO|nr:hypothetical protein H5410_023655 [Solanum commersonii]